MMATLRRSGVVWRGAASSGGFTLMEILIAIGILAIGMMGVLSMLSAGTVTHRRARDQATTSLLAASLMSDFQADLVVTTSPQGTAHDDKSLLERYEDAKPYFADYEAKTLNEQSQEYQWVREFRDAESAAFGGFKYDVDFTKILPGEYLVNLRIKWGEGQYTHTEPFEAILMGKPY